MYPLSRTQGRLTGSGAFRRYSCENVARERVPTRRPPVRIPVRGSSWAGSVGHTLPAAADHHPHLTRSPRTPAKRHPIEGWGHFKPFLPDTARSVTHTAYKWGQVKPFQWGQNTPSKTGKVVGRGGGAVVGRGVGVALLLWRVLFRAGWLRGVPLFLSQE
jgi:hypothetical protein